MRIALATWFPSDPSAPRGVVEAVSVNLARALARMAGAEIHVVTFDDSIGASEQLRWEGVTIYRLPRSPGSLLAFARGEGHRRLGEFLEELRPDLVHAHDTFGIMTRGLELPRVFTIHGFIHEDTRLIGGWKNRLRASLWKREEFATWAEQPHIIAISPYVRERLKGIARGVIHDIENPIDPACFEIQRNEEPRRILSVGVICRRKNPQALVDAVALLDPGFGVKLRLSGPVGEADYGERLAASIRDCDLTKHVELLGSLSAPKVREELARAAVFALCSFEEGAPLGIAEAMAAGVPIVTSNRCGMPYMVRHGETGFLVNPEDTHDISRHLDEILRDDQLRLRMGQAARVFAVEHFHPEFVANRTLRVYRQVIGEQESVEVKHQPKRDVEHTQD
jgi:glycosyltransferase involved in cell wall biosynthesis